MIGICENEEWYREVHTTQSIVFRSIERKILSIEKYTPFLKKNSILEGVNPSLDLVLNFDRFCKEKYSKTISNGYCVQFNEKPIEIRLKSNRIRIIVISNCHVDVNATR